MYYLSWQEKKKKKKTMALETLILLKDKKIEGNEMN